MSAFKIFSAAGARLQSVSSFYPRLGTATCSCLVFPGICGVKTGCISTENEIKIVFERGITLSYLASNVVVKTGYGMFLASISEGFVIDSVSRTRNKAAVGVRKSSNFPSIYCVQLIRKRIKNSRIRSAFSRDVDVNSCVIAIEIRGDLVAERSFFSVDFPNSKKFSIEFDPSIPLFYNAVVWVPAAFLMTFIGLKTLFFCESESSVNDISLRNYFRSRLFPPKTDTKRYRYTAPQGTKFDSGSKYMLCIQIEAAVRQPRRVNWLQLS